MIIIRWGKTEARRYIASGDWTDEEIRYGIHDAALAAHLAFKAAIERARLDGSLVRARCPGCGGSGVIGVGHCDAPNNCAVCQCRLCGGSGFRPDANLTPGEVEFAIDVDTGDIADVASDDPAHPDRPIPEPKAYDAEQDLEAFMDAFSVEPEKK